MLLEILSRSGRSTCFYPLRNSFRQKSKTKEFIFHAQNLDADKDSDIKELKDKMTVMKSSLRKAEADFFENKSKNPPNTPTFPKFSNPENILEKLKFVEYKGHNQYHDLCDYFVFFYENGYITDTYESDSYDYLFKK